MSTISEKEVDDLENQAVYDRNPSLYTGKEKAPLPYNYKEIRRLLWMKGADPVYAAALEEWDRKSKCFTSRIERKSKERASLQTEVYSLIGFYSVFQGVVLAAVSQSQPTVLQCRKFWIPVVLSVLASAVTYVAITQKHTAIKELKITIQQDSRYLKYLTKQEQQLRLAGRDFRFEQFSEGVQREETRERRKSWACCNRSKNEFISIALVVFAVVFPFFHWILLCT